MGQLEANCDSCGAPVKGFICGHCGALTARLKSAADENRALDEYHGQLQKLKPQEQSKWLLESGFLPDSPEVLIEAGIYCVPFLKNMSVYDAAAARLEAVILKLKLLPYEGQTRRAIEDFQNQIAEYKRQKKKDDLLGVGCLLVILALVAAFSWWLIRDAGLTIARAGHRHHNRLHHLLVFTQMIEWPRGDWGFF